MLGLPPPNPSRARTSSAGEPQTTFQAACILRCSDKPAAVMPGGYARAEVVIPAKAGIQARAHQVPTVRLDSRFRGNDGE